VSWIPQALDQIDGLLPGEDSADKYIHTKHYNYWTGLEGK
jgi:hypothetical protein